MPKPLRYLRIAFSATCVLACVLLLVLWVRSYRWAEAFSFPISTKHAVGIGSAQGGASVIKCQYAAGFYKGLWQMDRDSTADPSIAKFYRPQNRPGYHGVLGLGFINSAPFFVICLPYWFLLAMSIAIAGIPWRKQMSLRFSLRTLLIVTTLVAVVLGAIVWLRR